MKTSNEEGPAGIWKEYKIDLGHRRTKETKFSPEYNEYVRQIDNDINNLV
jgi:hypothetical protein